MTWPLNHSYPASETELRYPDHSFTITLRGINITNEVKSFSISGSRGQAVTGSLELVSYSSDVMDVINYFKDETPHNMLTGPEITISLSVGTSSPTFPTFVLTGVRGERVMELSFSDKTEWANLDNQSVNDVLADEGDTDTAHDVIDDLESLVPITIIPSFADWPIRTFRMNDENVLSKIDDICAVTQSYRRFEGDIMYLEQIGDNPDSWTIVDREHIPEGGMNLNRSADGLKTKFNAFRVSPQDNFIAPPYPCVGGDCVGRTVDIQFNRPSSRVDMKWEARNGDLVDGVFLDENGDPLNVTPASIWAGGSTKAYGWQATYEPSQAFSAEWVPQYRVLSYGTNSQVVEASAFNLTEAADALESIYGERPDLTNLVTNLILNGATMQNMLDAIVEEARWSVDSYSLQTPFVSAGLCGSEVVVTHKSLGLSSASLIMDQFNIGYSVESGFDCSYQLLKKV